MSHVFISYTHENTEAVNRLYTELTDHGIRVWLDRNDIQPGSRWRSAIWEGIREGAFFIACFSQEYRERDTTYMNEELLIAIEELRLRPTDRSWFIPVKLNECAIPDRNIGLGETLKDLQYVALYADWEDGVHRIVEVIRPEFSSQQEFLSSEASDSEPIGSTEESESEADVYSEAIEYASDGNLLKWRRLFRQVRASVSRSLIQWGRNELLSRRQQGDNEEEFVNKAVKIVSPLISVALVGVESNSEQFRDQKSVLHSLLNISDANLDSQLDWKRIRNFLGYVYHSLHGALSINTAQVGLAMDLANDKVELYQEGDFRKVWEERSLMGWSPLLEDSSCKASWKFLISAHSEWEWLHSIFPEESEYRASLVAYYMALHIHELASVIDLGQQEDLSANYVRNSYVPSTFVREGSAINRHAISLLRQNSETLNELWSSLGVTRTEMENSWRDWIHQCELWLREVYGIGVEREVYHKHLFENF